MQNKLDIQYVVSAVGAMGIYNHKKSDDYEIYTKILNEVTENFHRNIKNDSKNCNNSVGILYNAYTEKNLIDQMKTFNNLNSEHVYADSGGLQMVTTGKTITEELKNQIYVNQAYADYAMCFDSIPLYSTSLIQTRNERSNIQNKVFDQSNHHQSAINTGQNIRKQTDYFRSIGAKTKVIIIVQGNNYQDMINFFKGIESCLIPESYNNISGLAVADTCIGNGELESIEMLRAAKHISEFCHENVKKHLHVLGIGSISRMKPIVYLINSEYLKEFKKISYDSSSHTCTFNYGLLKLNGTCKPLGTHKGSKVINHFSNVYDKYHESISKYISKEEFINSLFDETGKWTYSLIKKNNTSKEIPEKNSVVYLCNMMHTFYQIENFIHNIDKMFEDKLGKVKKGTLSDMAFNSLLNVKTEDDIIKWLDNNKYNIGSNRINRKENLTSVLTWFE